MIFNVRNSSVLIDDNEMSYVTFGSGNKTLVLLPGLSDGLVTVKGRALLLALPYRMFFKDYTVYMFSRKDRLDDNYSIQEMAKDQAEAMRLLGINKASIIGVSEGGMIAQYLAIDYPDLVEKLVIVSSSSNANDKIQTVLKSWIELVKQNNHRQLMIDSSEKSYSEKFLKKYRLIYPIIGFIGKPKNYQRFLVNVKAILNFNCLDELKKITCPTLIIGGKIDKIIGCEALYKIHEKIKNSELYVYEEYGHSVFEEADDFNQRVYNFLEK